MSEPENLDTDLTSYSLDDEDQLQPEDTLTGTGEPGEDALDAGYSPPDSARGSYAHGVTAGEQEDEETIDERIKQEVPDPHSAYGAPDNESGLDRERSGGDDQDSIDADDDWLGDAQIGDQRAGRLVGPDQGGADDDQSWATDAGVDGGAASAEEAAVHVIDGDSTDRGDRS